MTRDDLSTRRMIRDLRRRIETLEGRNRNDNRLRTRPIPMPRLARTTSPETGDYPTDGQIFPILFVDAEYDKDLDIPAFSVTDRSNVTQTMVYNLAGTYIPFGTTLSVFQNRGNITYGKGDWYCEYYAGAEVYPAKVNSTVTAATSSFFGEGLIDLYLIGSDASWVPGETAKPVYNPYTASLAVDTTVTVGKARNNSDELVYMILGANCP